MLGIVLVCLILLSVKLAFYRGFIGQKFKKLALSILGVSYLQNREV
jgi:uncharacterized membrane protein required for colicin V production